MLKILVYSCEMSESKKIQITVQEDRSGAKAIRAANRSIPATIQPEPLQNDIITEYIAKYLDKDPSVAPLMVELLRGKDFRLKKRLLYAIKNIRYSYDWNFRITEPILIETLFSLRKYKSLEWPLVGLETKEIEIVFNGQRQIEIGTIILEKYKEEMTEFWVTKKTK